MQVRGPPPTAAAFIVVIVIGRNSGVVQTTRTKELQFPKNIPHPLLFASASASSFLGNDMMMVLIMMAKMMVMMKMAAGSSQSLHFSPPALGLEQKSCTTKVVFLASKLLSQNFISLALRYWAEFVPNGNIAQNRKQKTYFPKFGWF